MATEHTTMMSRNTAWTVGTYTFIINVIMIFIQCLVLHKHGLKGQLVNIALQIPFSFVFALRDGRSITDGIFSAVREGTIIAALAVGHIVR